MAGHQSNIQNRSPWVVRVRSHPSLDRQFSYASVDRAQQYCESLRAQGRSAQVQQLETSFQLRIRRKGMKTQCVTFDTWAHAEQARLHIESKLSLSIVRDYAVATKYTVRQLMERYLKDVVPTHKGADIEKNRLLRMMRDEPFVDKKLAALTTEDLQDFIMDRLTDVAPATVDRDVDLISQVLHYADDVWKIAPVESPLKGLRRPKYFNERDRRLSGDEQEALLAAARADENPFIEPAIILALETAMRRGELLALHHDDVDYARRQVLVRDAKNGRSRRVPLTTRAMEVLSALPKNSGEPLLNLTANALKLAFFRRVIPASGLEDVHFHDLRHESISRLAESGEFQLIELQAISGHRDTRMLLRYAHLCSGGLANKMDKLRLGTEKRYVHRGRMRKAFTPGPIIENARVKHITSTPASAKANSNVIAFSAARQR